MLKNAWVSLALIAPLAMLAAPAHAAENPLSIGVGASTLGYGADIDWRLTRRLSVGVGHSVFSISGDQDTTDIHYKGDLDLSNTMLRLNLHPFAGGFRISAGVVKGHIRAKLIGTPQAGGSYDLNGTQYTPAQVGELHSQIDLKDDQASYFGIGYRAKSDGLGMYFDLGVVAAKINTQLSATGAIASNPQFQQNLAAEQAKLKDEATLDYYPVLGLGFIYRF